MLHMMGMLSLAFVFNRHIMHDMNHAKEIFEKHGQAPVTPENRHKSNFGKVES